jgi:hypothetical protein
MITLYTDISLLTLANRPFVHPLLFDLHYYEHADPSVKEHYSLVNDASQAEAFILPLNYLAVKQQSAFDTLLKLARFHKKKLHIYTGGDYGKTFRDPTIMVWRNAGFKKTNSANTIIIPAFMSDPVANGHIALKTHNYCSKPAISFTGFAHASFKEEMRVILSTLKSNAGRLLKMDESDFQSFFNAAGKRMAYLKQLEASQKIETSFIYRNKYRAGAQTAVQREQTTHEFFDNLNSSPYVFCMRGAGNFSIRFYEALACGRIPVLVDTDVVLPLESIISWDNHICRVQFTDNIVKRLLHFHEQHDSESFEALQQSNRLLYEHTLVRHHYFCTLHDLLISTM